MISTDLNRAEFNGDASATVFVFRANSTDIPVKDKSHIKVYVDTVLKTIVTHYTVGFAGTTATITFTSGNVPPLGTANILFIRDVPFTQDTDLANNSQLDAESLESQLDLIVNQSQQINDNTSRNLRFSDTLTAANATETHSTLNVTSALRANKSLKFNASGNLIVSTIDTDKAEDYVLESKSYATETPAVVNHYSAGVASAQSGVYSSKEHAVGSPPDGSAKEWATTDTVAVTGSLYSAKQYAANAALSETSANASADAVAIMYDAFNDKYLGSMADTAAQGTNPTNIVCSWSKNSSTITVASKTNMKVGQIVVGAGIETSPVPNIISIHPSADTIVISDNMDAAGSSVALTFTGHGIYGTFNGTKDGPALDNDGAALSDGALYFNTTEDVLKVYDTTSATWKNLTPSSSEMTAITAAVADASDIGTVAGLDTEIGLLGALNTEIALIGTSPYAHPSTGFIKLVAEDASDIGAVAGKATEIGRLGTVDAVADMALLGLAPVITDMDLLGATGVIADMDVIGATGVIDDLETVANNSANVTKVADIDDKVTIVAGLGSSGADVTTVAGKATEIGRLGTVDTVADMVILATTPIVADLDILADRDTELGLLGTSDMAHATTGNLKKLGDISTSINTAATNLTGINYFGDQYQVDDFSPSDPTTDGGSNALAAGDLAFDTTAAKMKVYSGTGWDIIAPTGSMSSSGGVFTGTVTFNNPSINSGGFSDNSQLNLSGTLVSRFYLSNSCVLTGDITLAGNVVIAKVSNDGVAATLTTDSTTRTISGTGALTNGELFTV